MMRVVAKIADGWVSMGPRFLPFADAATATLPLRRLLRLALFQVSVGMATALLIGTLNRVMIIELRVSAWVVSLMIGLPLLFAPFRALIGFRSDHHRSAFGWRRVPYIWIGTMCQWGGLAIMPFALLVLSGDGVGPVWVGQVSAALAFLLVGAGVQITQTAGLALATDLAPEDARPRVVALMYVMLLVGLVASGFAFSWVLADFSPVRLIQVVQGAAVVTLALNVIALWQQEGRNRERAACRAEPPPFRAAWRSFVSRPEARRFLWVVALGTAAFNMQEVVLEPYGGEVLGLAVSATSLLTAILAGGALAAYMLAARLLSRGSDPFRVSGAGAVIGLAAFACVTLAAPLESATLFRIGTVLIGFGAGLFAVGTLTAAMTIDLRADAAGNAGLALGAWGAVQATAAGLSMAAGGGLRDIISGLAANGSFGPVLQAPLAGYTAVYHVELFLLFATLVAIGPLVRRRRPGRSEAESGFGLAQFPH
jgi:BCD family chlorophyll transporter-like MFS transporter